MPVSCDFAKPFFLARVSSTDPLALPRLVEAISNGIRLSARGTRWTVLCIGSDRSTGDALGPLVGSRLREDPALSADVLGTLDEPVHAANLSKVIVGLKQASSGAVLVVDASLGQSDHVGSIAVGVGPLRPGAGVKKNLPKVGDMYVTGTVNVAGFMEHAVLQSTRLSLVMRMARIISTAVAESLLGQKPSGIISSGRGIIAGVRPAHRQLPRP